jgi:hypothetical protein
MCALYGRDTGAYVSHMSHIAIYHNRQTTGQSRGLEPPKVARAGGLLAIIGLMTSVVLTLAEALAGYRGLARERAYNTSSIQWGKKSPYIPRAQETGAREGEKWQCSSNVECSNSEASNRFVFA